MRAGGTVRRCNARSRVGACPVRLNPKQLQRLAQAASHPAGLMTDDSAEVIGKSTVRSAVDPRDLAAIRSQISLDAPGQFDDWTPLANLLATVRYPDHDANDAVEFLGSILQKLTAREQMVLKLRFGLDGEPRHSLNQLGKLLQVSKERVRQIEDARWRSCAASPTAVIFSASIVPGQRSPVRLAIPQRNPAVAESRSSDQETRIDLSYPPE